MITVRRATREDIGDLTDLFNLYRTWYRQPADIAAARKFLLERIDRDESVIFCAFEGDKMAGFTQLYPIFSSVRLLPAWLLNDLYVAAAHRQKGMAKKLLDAAAAHGREMGAAWLLLQTGNDNYTAQAVYEKNGWKRVSDYFYELPLAEP